MITVVCPPSPFPRRILLYLDPIDVVSFDLEVSHKCTYCREPFLESGSEHSLTSTDLSLSTDSLWGLVKSLALDKLFPTSIESVTASENSIHGVIESMYDVLYKDGAKWTV